MRKILVCSAVALVTMVGAAMAQQAPVRSHTLVAAADVKWGEPPPVFEKGMSFAGGYALMPADMRHSAMARTAVTVQVSGIGPFALTYVNPADDPSRRAARK